MISRAGGISGNGDPFSSILFRKNDSNIVFRLDLALSKNYYNYKVEDNDSIYIPKKSDLVFINGNGQKRFDYMEETFISVPFNSGYNAKKIINT